MKTKSSLTFVGSLLGGATLCFGTPALHAADGPYHFIKEIHVGGDARWDYLSVDEKDRRLFVAHGTDVVVIDLDKDEVVGRITNTPGVHGFVAVPDLGRGFSSNGGEAKASIVDLKTLQTIQKVDTGQNPDAILYDPAKKEVYTFNGRSQSATVFQAETGKVVATIPLSGKPETGVVDTDAGRVYVNLENKSTIAVIDTQKHEVVATWPIAPGEEATGLAFDAAHKRLFLGCGNKLLVMVDSTSGKVLGSVPAGDGIDAAGFDPTTQLAFASAGEGNLAIAHEDSPDKLTLVQTLTTEPRARTMSVDTTTHRIYLACAKFEAPAASTSGSAKPRAKAVPDSFKILVYGSEGK